MRLFTFLWALLLLPAIGMAQSGNEGFVEPPAGEPTDYYYLSDELRLHDFGFMARNVREIQFYFTDGNDVYMRDLIDYGGYLKGTFDKISGKLSFPNGQAVEQVQFGVGSKMQTIFFAELDPVTNTPMAGNMTLQVKEQGGRKVISATPGMEYALYYVKDGKNILYKQARNPSFVEKSVFDSFSGSARYTYTDNLYGSGNADRSITCTAVDRTIFLKGLEELFGDAWAHATVIDDNGGRALFIPTNQYLGNYSAVEDFVLVSGAATSDHSLNTEGYTGLKLPMAFDAGSKTYKGVADKKDFFGAAHVHANGKREWATIYENVVIYLPENIVGTATGVKRVNASAGTKAADNLYYDLQGRATTAPVRGVYIHGGKKVVVK